MTASRKIAFFAPIKPPDHPIPSGDRLIAGNLVSAFRLAGHSVSIASRYICYSKRSAPEILNERKAGAQEEAARILNNHEHLPEAEKPDIWITYHPYCKAPDWIGPIVSQGLGIPYITIEAAKTGQGKNDEWKPWREEAQSGIKQADRHLVFKPTDHAYLSELLGSDNRLYQIPPFIDADKHGLATPRDLPEGWDENTPVLVTAGMMRKGKKERNFEILAELLSRVSSLDWNLVVVGGGPQEESIKTAFADIHPSRIHWCGEVEHSDVLRWMRSGDCFIWPGWKEPIGMVYLEAQLQELPVIAFKSMGVPLVVEHGTTGFLSKEGDMDALRANLATILGDAKLRKKTGKAARKKVLSEHSLEAAAKRLDESIRDL